jgi:hypothetical protein
MKYPENHEVAEMMDIDEAEHFYPGVDYKDTWKFLQRLFSFQNPHMTARFYANLKGLEEPDPQGLDVELLFNSDPDNILIAGYHAWNVARQMTDIRA